jgi:hypothetical protein
MNSPALTLTGLVMSLAILYANLRPWWKGPRELKALAPFGQGFMLGALATVCTGGLLGWLHGCTARAANDVGDKAVGMTTGSASSAPLTRGSLGQLTPEGGLIVALFTVAVILAWKAAKKDEKKRITGGAFCGTTLCITAGIAGALGWLPELVNTLGMQLRTMVEGAGVL